MKKGRLVSILVCATLVGSFSLVYINRLDDSENINVVAKKEKTVIVESLGEASYSDRVKYYGKIGYGEEKNVIAMVDEKVTYVGVKEGDYVKEGQVLVKFDSSKIDEALEKSKADYEKALEKAKVSDGKVDGLRKNLEDKKIELNNLKEAIKKIDLEIKVAEEELIKVEKMKEEEAISEEEYIKKKGEIEKKIATKNSEKVLQTGKIKTKELEIIALEKSIETLGKVNLDGMQAQSSKKMYDEMKKMKDNYIIKAPISGTVTSFNAVLNKKIESKMMPLLTIGNKDSMIFKFGIDSDKKEDFKIGNSYKVKIESGNKTYNDVGIIKEVSDVKDMKTGQYMVSAEIKNNENYKINDYINLFFVKSNKDSKNMISKNALIREEDKTYVYIVKDNIVEKREITIGKESNHKVEVKKGLKLDEQVVVRGREFIKEGETVNIVEDYK